MLQRWAPAYAGVTIKGKLLGIAKNLRVMIEMIVDERCDEVVAMIVTGMATQRERLAN